MGKIYDNIKVDFFYCRSDTGFLFESELGRIQIHLQIT